jgi:hypothetical protein
MNNTDFIMCDACGLTFPPSHMADNTFVGHDLCQPCDDDICADMPDHEPMTEWEMDDWASQYDDDPNPYHGDYSEM